MKEKDQRILASCGLGLAAGASTYWGTKKAGDTSGSSGPAGKSLLVTVLTGVATFILSNRKEPDPIIVVDKKVEVKVVETEKCVCKCAHDSLEPTPSTPPEIPIPPTNPRGDEENKVLGDAADQTSGAGSNDAHVNTKPESAESRDEKAANDHNSAENSELASEHESSAAGGDVSGAPQDDHGASAV